MTDPAERPRADLDVVRSWLKIIYPPGSIMHISANGQWAGKRFTNDPGGLAAAVEYVRQLDVQRVEGVYARMQPLKPDTPSGGRGRAIDAAALPCLWADIDIAGPGHAETNLPGSVEDALSTIKALPEPTYVVNSGGGIYPIWMLTNPLPLLDEELHSTAAKLSEEWNQLVADGHSQHGWKYGTGVHDLARVLRIPGTVNRKAGLERPTSVRNGGGTYTALTLLGTVRALRKPSTVTPGVASAASTYSYNAVTTNPSERPGDVYNREAPWEDALGPDFVKIRTLSDGSAEWAWADDPHHDVKLTTDRNGLNNAFFFTTSWILAAQEPHSKFYVYAHRVHAGDLSAATKDVASRFGPMEQRKADDFFAQYATDATEMAHRRHDAAAGTEHVGVVDESTAQPLTPSTQYDRLVDTEYLRVKAREEALERRAAELWEKTRLEARAPLSFRKMREEGVPEPEWLVDEIMEKGWITSIAAPGGSGKSILAMEIAYKLATNKPLLNGPARQAKVLYLDHENDESEIFRHFVKFGYDETDDEALEANLVYQPMPDLAPLDTAQGGAQFAALLDEYEPDLVILDTLTRFVSGPEDKADTWNATYRNSILHLKRRGIACLPLDHVGKDGSRGSRGSSAKPQFVDNEFGGTALDNGVSYVKTKKRTNRGAKAFTIVRHEQDGRLWHVLTPADDRSGVDGQKMLIESGQAERERVERLAAIVDATGADPRTTRDGWNREELPGVARIVRSAGEKASDALLSKVVALRVERGVTDAMRRAWDEEGAEPLGVEAANLLQQIMLRSSAGAALGAGPSARRSALGVDPVFADAHEALALGGLIISRQNRLYPTEKAMYHRDVLLSAALAH